MAKNICNKYISNSASETKKIAHDFAAELAPNDVIALQGDLGAGKTQFVQGVADFLEIKDQVISPTFNILLQYEDGKIPLYHFDLYRLNREDELDDIAFFETIESNGVSFIEWSEKFPNALPDNTIYIRIKALSPNKREITIEKSTQN